MNRFSPVKLNTCPSEEVEHQSEQFENQMKGRGEICRYVLSPHQTALLLQTSSRSSPGALPLPLCTFRAFRRTRRKVFRLGPALPVDTERIW